MSFNILENVYYLTAIIVSLGIFRGFFNLMKISDKYEILLISNYHKKIIKCIIFIKYFILAFFLYCCIYTYLMIFNGKAFISIDCIMYGSLMFLCDYFSSYLFRDSNYLTLYIKLIPKDINIKRCIFVIVSVGFSFLFHFISKIIGLKCYVIIQVIFFIIIYCNLFQERYIHVHNQDFDVDDKMFIIYLSPLIIKIIFIFNYKLVNKDIDLSISGIISALSDIFYSDKFVIILSSIIVLSYIYAKRCIDNYFDYTLYLEYKNKLWRIFYITNDNYALCIYLNFMITINIDIIKNNYVCVYDRWNYLFYEKEKLKEFL